MKTSDTILLVYFFSFIVAGVAEGMAPTGAEWPLAIVMSHTFLIAIMTFSWCGAHATENRITPPGGSKLLAGLFPPLGIPYYMFAGYGLKKGSVKLLKAILFLILCTSSYNVTFNMLHDA
jgi:hypothetical protein